MTVLSNVFFQKYHNCGSSGLEKLPKHIARLLTVLSDVDAKLPQEPQHTLAVIHCHPRVMNRSLYELNTIGQTVAYERKTTIIFIRKHLGFPEPRIHSRIA